MLLPQTLAGAAKHFHRANTILQLQVMGPVMHLQRASHACLARQVHLNAHDPTMNHQPHALNGSNHKSYSLTNSTPACEVPSVHCAMSLFDCSAASSCRAGAKITRYVSCCSAVSSSNCLAVILR